MTISDVITAIATKNQKEGFTLNPSASTIEIIKFETKIGFLLPPEFKALYSVCNGFECEEDMFRFIPLDDIIERGDHGENWFHFAEYMIFCDIWTLRKNNDRYEIVNLGNTEFILCTSLTEFLEHFLAGNVFEDGGLYHWRETLH